MHHFARSSRIFHFLAILAVFAVPAWGQSTVDLRGRVLTDEGRTIPSGVTVRLETSDGILAGEQPANSNGDFEFGSLHKTRYTLTVTAEGFQTFQKDIDLSEAANMAVVQVNLSPQVKARVKSDAPALTDDQAPKPARKEYEKGSRALRDRKLNEAQIHLGKAVEYYPCYARAQTDLAVVFSVQKDGAAAEAVLEKAIACDPGFLDAYLQLGQLLNAEKKFGESEKVLEEAVRRSPGAWQPYYQLAVAHYGQGEYQKAEEDFVKVPTLNPAPPPELHIKLADVYFKLRAYDKAYAQLQAYLQADPNGRFAAKVRETMKQMAEAGAVRPEQAKALPGASAKQ